MVRVAFVFIFAILIATLAWCGLLSYRSKKSIGKSVCFFCLSLIPPVLGNMIIISATNRALALVGCYTYYIGMDLVMFALMRFTAEYCSVKNRKSERIQKITIFIDALLAIDVIQMLLNPIFGHAFKLHKIEAYGAPYYQMIPLAGQSFHRAVCYGAMAVVFAIFFYKSLSVPRIYRERYTVILISMIAGTLWQTFYIFSRTPIDRSMIGFGFIGLCFYYFSMRYRPLRLMDRMLVDIVSDMSEAVFLYGPEGRCIWVNDPGKELTDIEEDNVEKAGDRLEEMFEGIFELPENTDTQSTIGTGDETRYYVISCGSFKDRKDKKLGSYVRIRDITSDKRRMDMELYAANHDALTGVYTREYTFKQISDGLRNHAFKDHYLASIYICDFKMFNDAYGREFGDYALIQISEWLRKSSDERCIFGRISGDTFGSCLPAEMFNEKILEEQLANFKVRKGDIEHHLIIHIGFYKIEEQDQDVSILFDRTMLALDSIRDDYKRHVAFFDKKIRDKMLWNQEISAQLKNAIEENQVRPYLQPIADRNGNIVGAEALARWLHPKHGFMPPADFIPVFEDNGMIVDLDKHIWESACKILAKWKGEHPDLFISVNVSPKDFYMTDVFADIRKLVKEYDIEPKNLRIEVTETSMMGDTDGKIKVLDEFRKLGFVVEMDDFGSGYSSLNMLKDMPVDVLKIDMKFLGKSEDENRANIIVKNVIKLSEDLGITSLTEGVETDKQFDMLAEIGCILFQGYYFSKPVPLEDFERMLDEMKSKGKE